MVLSSKTFQIFKHAKGINTRITMLSGCGGTATARLFSSWVISKSLFEELSAAAAPSAPSAGHPQVRPPCLMLPATRDNYRFFNPINKKIFKIKKKKKTDSDSDSSSPRPLLLPNSARCFWSSHGWLAFIDPRDCGLYLKDPFSVSKDVIRLPSIGNFPTIAGTTRKSNYNKFIIQYWNDSNRYPSSPRSVSKHIIERVASSSAFAFGNNNNNDGLLMAIGGMEGCFTNLLFCKPGDTTWTALSGPLHPYEHIIPSSTIDKVFYAMGLYGKIEAWDLRDLSCIKRTVIDYKRSLCSAPKFCDLEADLRATPRNDKRRYLVDSSGDLLLVYRYVAVQGVAEDGTILKDGVQDHIPHKTLRFDVYKMDFSYGVWTYVNSLGDRALFVGLCNSFSLHVCDYPGLRPNSIYFADYCYLYGGYDMGVYNLEDNSIETFCPFGNLKKIVPEPFWVAPNPYRDNVAEWLA